MAWDRLREDVIKEPLKVANIQEIADRLNLGAMAEANLPQGSFYAAGGKMQDGIIDRILSEMAAKFPAVKPNLKLPKRS